MSKWTPEPWTIGAGSHVCGMWSGMIRVESPEDFHSNGIKYPDGSTRSFTNVVCGTTGHSETARENMLRIVACVNAMAGIPDPAAFVEEAKALRSQVADLTAQRTAHFEDINTALTRAGVNLCEIDTYGGAIDSLTVQRDAMVEAIELYLEAPRECDGLCDTTECSSYKLRSALALIKQP